MYFMALFQTFMRIGYEWLPVKWLYALHLCFNNISIIYGHRQWKWGWRGMEGRLERREEGVIYWFTIKKERLQLNHLSTTSSLTLSFTVFPSSFLSLIHTHTHTRGTQVMALPLKKIELCVPSNYLSGVNNGPNNIFTLSLPINF